MSDNLQWSLLARILRPQGRAGEVLAELFSDFPERFVQNPDVFLAESGFSELETALQSQRPVPQAAHIIAHWLPVGRNAGRIVLHFAGTDSISDAEQLSGKEVIIPADARMPLAADTSYISDLVGCMVYDSGKAVGTVLDVEFPTTPDGLRRLEQAAPLLVVRGGQGDDILIPFAKEFLLEIDISAKALRMRLPEGLIDINAPESKEAPAG